MSTAHLLNSLLPLRSVQLGRLVCNPNKPHQDFIDPLESRPAESEIIRTPHTNFRETRRFTKSSNLRSYISRALSLSFARHTEGEGTLTAPEATTYELENSGQWFETACAESATREFLERSYQKQDKAYLIVGFRTAHDAKLAQSSTGTTGQRAGVDPASAVQASIVATALAVEVVGPAARLLRNTDNHVEVAYEAPGEQVFSVLYRKVRFRWFSSKIIGTVSLESNHRWVSCWDIWRGAEEAEEEDDVIEANLTDLSDVEEE